MTTIGRNILTLREKKRLTQEGFGKLIGASKQMVSNWENGQNRPSPKYLDKIAEVLDVSISDLYREIITYETKVEPSNVEEETLSYRKAMEALVDSKDQIIELQKREIKRLEEQLRQRSKQGV